MFLGIFKVISGIRGYAGNLRCYGTRPSVFDFRIFFTGLFLFAALSFLLENLRRSKTDRDIRIIRLLRFSGLLMLLRSVSLDVG